MLLCHTFPGLSIFTDVSTRHILHQLGPAETICAIATGPRQKGYSPDPIFQGNAEAPVLHTHNIYARFSPCSIVSLLLFCSMFTHVFTQRILHQPGPAQTKLLVLDEEYSVRVYPAYFTPTRPCTSHIYALQLLVLDERYIARIHVSRKRRSACTIHVTHVLPCSMWSLLLLCHTVPVLSLHK